LAWRIAGEAALFGPEVLWWFVATVGLAEGLVLSRVGDLRVMEHVVDLSREDLFFSR